MIYIGGIFSQFLPLSLNALSDGESLEFRVVTSEASTIVVNWGDGTTDVYDTSFSGGLNSTTISHTYATAYNGTMEISCTSGNNKIERFDNFDASTDIITFTTNQIGSFTDLKRFILLDISGNSVPNLVEGDIENLPSTLEYFFCRGNNETTGDIEDLPLGLLRYDNRGFNTTTGDIGNLPPNLEFYSNFGNNTTTGDIGTLPTTLTLYANEGNNTTSGSLGSLLEGIRLPADLTYYSNIGDNTTTGDIGYLPINLDYFHNWGNNTTTGDIGTLPTTLTYYSNIGDTTGNTTFGDIGDLPTTLQTYRNQGSNTTTGDVSTLPINLEVYDNQGDNTTVGDVAQTPLSIRYFVNIGQSEASYTTKVWNSSMTTVFVLPTGLGKLSTSEVDQLLIDLSAVTSWVIINPSESKEINLSNNNDPRSATSDTAVLALSGTLVNGATPTGGKFVKVTTN